MTVMFPGAAPSSAVVFGNNTRGRDVRRSQELNNAYSPTVINSSDAGQNSRSNVVRPFESSVDGTASTDDLVVLLKSAASGDQAGFSSLYDTLAPMLYGIILRIVRDHARSEEVTQEVFVELWRVAPTFDERRGNVRAFAVTIARRRAIDCVRSVEAARSRDGNDVGRSHCEVESVEELVVDGAEANRVRVALERLPEAQQKAIGLAYFESLSYRQVAEQLDIPIGTIKTRIRDGMTTMRSELR